MCTAVTLKTKDLYFGRTLDYEFSYGESIVITPRNFPLEFRHTETLQHHYAMIGTAHVANGYPMYYDAVNEAGLCIAGLNFVGNAFYRKPDPEKLNVAQFELIQMILGKCADVDEALSLIKNINITDTTFSPSLPAASLHWIIADKNRSVVLESLRDKITVYDDPVGVLTNNPTFDVQMLNLNNYMHLSPDDPQNSFAPSVPLDHYSRGMGGIGLPGDLSSMSRFVRAAFVKMNSVCGQGETESVSQFFHILGSVCQQRGCCRLGSGEYEISIYTSCCNADKGIYYYKTYDNSQITAVDMHKADLDGTCNVVYPMRNSGEIYYQN